MRIGASTRLRTARRCPARAGRDTPEPTPDCTVRQCADVHPLSLGQGTAPGCFRRGRAFAAIPVTAQRRCRSAFRHMPAGTCPPAPVRRHLPAGTCPPATMPRHLSSERSCSSIKTGVAAGTARVVHVAPGQLPHRRRIAQGSTGSSPSVTRGIRDPSNIGNSQKITLSASM